MNLGEFALLEDWEAEDVWGLPGVIQIMPIASLDAHLDLPFLSERLPYDLTPRQVMSDPHSHMGEYSRMWLADDFPIDIVQHPIHGHFVILDGLHRLMRAAFMGRRAVRVRVISWVDFKKISRGKSTV